MASSTNDPTPTMPAPAPEDDEVVREFGSLLRVYKSARVERPLMVPPVGQGLDTIGIGGTSVGYFNFCGPAGVASIFLLLLLSDGLKKLLVYVHGGGFMMESAHLPQYHCFLNRLTATCPALGVSIDYRLTPEQLLPTAYNDCLIALHWRLSATNPWVATHGDLNRVHITEDSCGANICHYPTIHSDVAARLSSGKKPLKGAALIHPWFWGSEAVGGHHGCRSLVLLLPRH
jgi:acetyl esterase/lipase